MKNFIKLLKDINFTLDQIFIFNSMLDSLLLFLAIYLFLSLFNFYPSAALVPAIAYFILSFFTDIKKNKSKVVEGQYAQLREKLRTAADNIGINNPVVEELQEEVSYEMKGVKASSFINTKKVYLKILSSIALSFVILLLGTMNIAIIDMKAVINGEDGLLNKLYPSKDSVVYAELNESDDLYGKKAVALLGSKELNIQIMPVKYDISVREEGEIDEKEFDDTFPKDVFVESASAYEEEIPKEQQELVKNYFNRLAKG